jgi:hypothetical protein
MNSAYKLDKRRNLAVAKRDIYGISAREMITIKILTTGLVSIASMLKLYRKKLSKTQVRKLENIMKLMHEAVISTLVIPIENLPIKV